jgi:hypothetical protein
MDEWSFAFSCGFRARRGKNTNSTRPATGAGEEEQDWA